MKKVFVVGSSGRMGQEVIKALESEKQIHYGYGLAEKRSDKKTHTKLSGVNALDVGVVIDFSNPKVSVEVVEWCLKNKLPLVCGTTGFTESGFKKLKKASKKIPVLYSSNMSLGIATLRRALKSLAAVSRYDFQIVEVHHAAKKDSPSGTAKTLQEDLEKAVGRKLPKPFSIRGGGVFGIHEIHSLGEEETLTFTHSALNRSVFAKGAVQAAKFLLKQKPGFYTLDETLDWNK